MAYHPSAFCDRRRQAAAFFVSIGLAMSLLIVPWFASSAGGASPSPTTSVLIPSNGATLSGTSHLDASASNATSVEFRLFGGVFGFNAPVLCTATPTLYGWLCGWNTRRSPTVRTSWCPRPSARVEAHSVLASASPSRTPCRPRAFWSLRTGRSLSGSTYLDASATNATSVEFRLFGGVFGFNAPVLCTATLTSTDGCATGIPRRSPAAPIPRVRGVQCGWKRIQFGRQYHDHTPHYRLRRQRRGRHRHPDRYGHQHGRDADHRRHQPLRHRHYAERSIGVCNRLLRPHRHPNQLGSRTPRGARSPWEVSTASSGIAITPNGATAYVATRMRHRRPDRHRPPTPLGPQSPSERTRSSSPSRPTGPRPT